MGERERLAIFNILYSHFGKNSLTSMSALDLYAGTGALGLEALSRGASSCTFVENSHKVAWVLKQNLSRVDEPTKVIMQDVSAFIRHAQATNAKYNLIFLDPPYSAYSDTLVTDALTLLAPNGALVVSSPGEPSQDGKLVSRQFARCVISVFVV